MMNEDIRHEIVDNRFGYVYVSGNGQLVVDRHESDAEHVLALPDRAEPPLHDCRFYVADVVPKEWHGSRGQLTVVRSVRADGKVVAVQLMFTQLDQPETTRPNPLT